MNSTLDAALTLAKGGFLVFPCRQHDRRPATMNGFKDATTDERTIRTWFSIERGLNLAIRTGMQPSGLNLVAIDVDAQNGGLETWDAWIAEHHVPETARTETPSGGFHLFFDAEGEVRNGVHRLGNGVDVRGTDGYVLASPSLAPSKTTGEINAYTITIDVGETGTVARMPHDLYEGCTPLVAPSPNGHRRPAPQFTGTKIYDLARIGWVWDVELEADGWSLQRRRGADSEWTRPGKDPRMGTSATLHGDGDGPFTVWSTSLPSGGKPNRGGVGETFSPWDYILTFRAGGDFNTAVALVRGAGPRPAGVGSGPTPIHDTTGDKASYRLPVAPAEYWDDERNAHILAAARARRVGPDALDINVLCLQSLLIPPAYVLPPLIGGTAPINMLGCILARTGETKTTATRVAKDLLGPMPPWVLMLSVGSGEGIGATYLMEETTENLKGQRVKTGKLVRNRDIWAGFFETDEGLNLVQQARRQGATIISTLCKAWSGSQLGEANADPSKRRIVEAMSYRLAAVINIQPANFRDLFSVANTGTGLTGRFLFAPAADYDVPDVRPAWPGLLEFPRLANVPVEIGVPDVIIDEIDAAIVAVHRNASLAGDGDATSHRNQVALRIAAVRAIARGERAITIADWTAAKVRTDVSAACQSALEIHQSSVRRDLRHREDEAKALSSVRQATITEQADVAKFKGRIIERCGRGSLTRREIKNLKDAPRDVLWLALDEALAEGLIVKDGSNYRRAR